MSDKFPPRVWLEEDYFDANGVPYNQNNVRLKISEPLYNPNGHNIYYHESALQEKDKVIEDLRGKLEAYKDDKHSLVKRINELEHIEYQSNRKLETAKDALESAEYNYESDVSCEQCNNNAGTVWPLVKESLSALESAAVEKGGVND